MSNNKTTIIQTTKSRYRWYGWGMSLQGIGVVSTLDGVFPSHHSGVDVPAIVTGVIFWVAGIIISLKNDDSIGK